MGNCSFFFKRKHKHDISRASYSYTPYDSDLYPTPEKINVSILRYSAPHVTLTTPGGTESEPVRDENQNYQKPSHEMARKPSQKAKRKLKSMRSVTPDTPYTPTVRLRVQGGRVMRKNNTPRDSPGRKKENGSMTKIYASHKYNV